VEQEDPIMSNTISSSLNANYSLFPASNLNYELFWLLKALCTRTTQTSQPLYRQQHRLYIETMHSSILVPDFIKTICTPIQQHDLGCYVEIYLTIYIVLWESYSNTPPIHNNLLLCGIPITKSNKYGSKSTKPQADL